MIPVRTSGVQQNAYLRPFRSMTRFRRRSSARSAGGARKRPRPGRGHPLRGLVVQGGVTTAVLNAVVAEDLPGPAASSSSSPSLAPVRPGDTITGRVTVTSVRDDKPVSGLDVAVVGDDGAVAVEGTAVCYTVDLAPAGG